jgi:RHS repeat-associated protein
VWQSVSVTTSGGGTAPSGNVYIAKTPEAPTTPYDLDGNLIQDGRWDYTWDSENRLIQMTVLSTISTNSWKKLAFDYDWMGRRIRKQTYAWNPTTAGYVLDQDIRFLYDGWNLVAEMKGTGTSDLVRSYLWGKDLSGSEQGAGGVGGLIGTWLQGSTTFNFASYDGNGNVAGLVSAYNGTTTGDGSINAVYEYGPFGEGLRVTSSLGKTNLTMRFSTKYTDDESDLVYYGYRYYSPSLGRWMSRDPMGERGGDNLLAFGCNNLISGFDGVGLEPGYLVQPGKENCLSYATGYPDAISPGNGGSLKDLMEHLGYSCRQLRSDQKCEPSCRYEAVMVYVHAYSNNPKKKDPWSDPWISDPGNNDCHAIRGDCEGGSRKWSCIEGRGKNLNVVTPKDPTDTDSFWPYPIKYRYCCKRKVR